MDKIVKQLQAWQEAAFANGVRGFHLSVYNDPELDFAPQIVSVSIFLKGDSSEDDYINVVFGSKLGDKERREKMDKIYNFVKHLL